MAENKQIPTHTTLLLLCNGGRGGDVEALEFAAGKLGRRSSPRLKNSWSKTVMRYESDCRKIDK